MARFKLSGVYRIVHKTTGKVYIGSSNNLKARMYWHKLMLSHGVHHCAHLQRVFNKYGPSSLIYQKLKICLEEDLIRIEQEWIDKTPKKLLMNSLPTAGSKRGYKVTETTKNKISTSHLRFIENNPDERKRRSESAKRQHAVGNFGRPLKELFCRDCGNVIPRKRSKNGRYNAPVKLCSSCLVLDRSVRRWPHRKGYPLYGRKCRKCRKTFIKQRLRNGNLEQSRLCPKCRPKIHYGGNYKDSKDKYERVLWDQGRSKRKYNGSL